MNGYMLTVITCSTLGPVVLHAPADTAYSIVEVGTLEDLTDTVPTPPTSTGLAINDAGAVRPGDNETAALRVERRG